MCMVTQMYRCSEYGKRFVYDTGTFSFYSHHNRDQWALFIQMTFEKDSLIRNTELAARNVYMFEYRTFPETLQELIHCRLAAVPATGGDFATTEIVHIMKSQNFLVIHLGPP